MFDICSVWNPLTPWSMVDCSTSVPMMIAHCTVDRTAHVTRSRDQTLFWAVFEGSRRTNKKRFPPGNLSLIQILVLVFKRYVVIQYVCSLLCRLIIPFFLRLTVSLTIINMPLTFIFKWKKIFLELLFILGFKKQIWKWYINSFFLKQIMDWWKIIKGLFLVSLSLLSECKRFEFSRAGGGGGYSDPSDTIFQNYAYNYYENYFFRIQTLWFSFIFHIEEILYSSLACAETDNDVIYM